MFSLYFRDNSSFVLMPSNWHWLNWHNGFTGGGVKYRSTTEWQICIDSEYTCTIVICVCGPAQVEKSTGWWRTDLRDYTLNLLIPAFHISHLLTGIILFYFPPGHITLDLMKQFVKGLSTESNCFHHLASAFPRLLILNIRAGTSDGSQIRQRVKD